MHHPALAGCKYCSHGKAGRRVWLGKDGAWVYRKPCNRASDRLYQLNRCDVVELTGKRRSSSCNDKHCYAEIVVKRDNHGAVIKTVSSSAQQGAGHSVCAAHVCTLWGSQATATQLSPPRWL